MADIFGNVQPPAWLQDLTALPKGEFGQSLGLALGAGLVALQPNESGDGVKGIGQGLKEARLNQQDPNWRVKTKALESQVVNNWANAATTWQTYDAQNQDLALWTTQDLPALSKYQQDLKTNPDATPPVMKSTRGQSAANTIAALATSAVASTLRRARTPLRRRCPVLSTERPFTKEVPFRVPCSQRSPELLPRCPDRHVEAAS